MLDLLEPKYRSTAVILCISSFLNYFSYNSIINILPLLVNDVSAHSQTEDASQQIIANILFSCVLEIPAVICSGLIPNIKFLGRLKTVKIGFFLPSILIFVSLLHQNMISFYLSFSKAVLYMTFNILCLYAAEYFPPSHKSAIIAAMYFCGRLANIFSIFFLNSAVQVNKLLVPWALCLSQLFTSILSAALPPERRV